MAGRSREAWNNEDIATLRELAAEGASIVTITRALERTREGVQRRARMLGVVISPGNGSGGST